MGNLDIDWQVFYDAAKKCHQLAADLRSADRPVHDSLKSSGTKRVVAYLAALAAGEQAPLSLRQVVEAEDRSSVMHQ